ncbi:MAG: ABC transporter ATP-binding protein [Clostridia bacterium]|nr:ABC transporter ATP-binding protein [Clostridia bacterium]
MKEEKKLSKFKLIHIFMQNSRRYFAISIIASLIATVCSLAIPKLISYSVDSVIGDLPPESPLIAQVFGKLASVFGSDAGGKPGLWILAAAIALLALLMCVFRYMDTVFIRRGSETLSENMRNMLFRHIMRIPMSWFSAHQTGDLIQRSTSDVETLRDFLSTQLTQVIRTVIIIVFSLVFMFNINTTLSLVALIFIPVIIGYSIFFHVKISKSFEEADKNEGILSAICQENLTGVRVVRAFGREKTEIEKYTKQNEKYTGIWIKVGKYMTWFWAAGDVITGLQMISVIVIGTVICVEGRITVGDLISFILYNSMLEWPVRMIGRTIANMSRAGVSVGRIGEILSAGQEKDAPDAVDCPRDGDIEFSHVSFSFDGETRILDDVSLKIPAGSTLGIIGMTGSGKSTLAALLTRLYELDEGCGTITVGGIDIRNIKLDSLRKTIGIVHQEPFLFSKTLGENIGITFDSPAERIMEIKEAAQAACLGETIEGFAKGYDTPVGERGVTLSGGQKQRTAIARVLAQGSPVMVFDDSLSAVDSETDARIRRSLAEKTAGTTVILISHRIQTLMNSDNIAVMSGGKITESGTHEELIKNDGMYRAIYDLQSYSGEEDE